jgi:phenylpyruvate tautomerase PptA (4-oxalocrotonate tautomerase family)
MSLHDRNNEKKLNDKEKDKSRSEEKIWIDSEVQLLKKWGEIASSYRLLHDRAFREFQIKSYGLAIPIIILSTLSGTASFSISSFPPSVQGFAPMVIGGVNIFVGILQTITQFLRVNEQTESHRVASITYGKFARNITTELTLPPNNRSYNGIDFVQMCRTEMDRMIEQSPIIPLHLLKEFDKNKLYKDITRPDVLSVSNIKVYEPDYKEKAAELIATVTEKLHEKHSHEKTNAQKIKEKIERSINPEKKEITVEMEVKEVLNEINLNDLESNIKRNISMSKLENNIINNRKKELGEIEGNGVVSKMLQQKKIESANKTIEKPKENYVIHIDEVNAELNK